MKRSRLSAEEIASGARTVRHLYEYICELRSHAGELEKTVLAVDRGYFVADEDDAARGLMVSYWQSRNAMLEVLNSFRQRIRRFSDAEPAEFLIPYTAALVLVDTARFVRSIAESRPVIRRKLNEAAIEFGVPGGTYDAIQKSLVSGRNAWHITRATRYFDMRRDEFVQIAPSLGISDLVNVATKLRASIDVSRSQYARAKFATRIDQWLRWVGRNTFSHSGYAIQKLTAGMMADVYVRRGHVPTIPLAVAMKLTAEVLQPTDIIIVRKEFAVTNYFLPGYWPHVAFVLGNESALANFRRSAVHSNAQGNFNTPDFVAADQWQAFIDTGTPACVVESMKDGVLVRDIASPLASDSFVVIRPRLSADDVLVATQKAMRHVGKPYDFNFDLRRSDRLVCTEVVYRALEGVGSIRFPLVQRMGRPTLSGLDLVQMSLNGQFFDPVAVYVPEDSAELQVHDGIKDVIGRKI